MDIKEILIQTPKADLAKAIKETLGLQGIRDVEDLWRDFHHVPDREEIKTGPSMISSGAGAEKAMKDYSESAPQISITKEYEEFSRTVEDFKSSSAKSFSSLESTIKEGFVSLKSALAPVKPVAKSDDSSECWERLGELEEAIGEMHDGEGVDVEYLTQASDLLEEAEKYIDEVDGHEKEEERQLASLKAHAIINKAWAAVRKARPVERYGLNGGGNQAAEAASGKREKEAELKSTEAKARALALKAKNLRKALGKSPDPDPDPMADPIAMSEKKKSEEVEKAEPFDKKEADEIKEAAEHFYEAGAKEHEAAGKAEYAAVKAALKTYYASMAAKAKKAGLSLKKSPDPEPDPDPKMKAEEPEKEKKKEEHEEHKAKSEEKEEKEEHMAKSPDPEPDPDPKMKAMAARLAAVEARVAENRPTMVPVIFKSQLNQDTFVETMYNRVGVAEDEGMLSADGAAVALSLIDRYRAAAKGHIHTQIVDQQLQQAPVEVQIFFDGITKEMQSSI